ncbi:MAG: DUF898 domain-containing protein [Pleurocapsa sp. SU_196_0]|nr:DUF898 domain-containing protein [Pleurocapsa sp. SU_196_0]
MAGVSIAAFMASNSSYRNIRFRFHGALGASYINYFLLPICAPFTLGFGSRRTPRTNNRDYVFGNAALRHDYEPGSEGNPVRFTACTSRRTA